MRGRGKECCEQVHAELGGVETPGALEVARIPGVSVPVCGYECGPSVCGVDVCVHECGEMRAAMHA